MLKVLNISRRKEVISLRNTGLTYAEIGRRLGLTRERVRQIINGGNTTRKKSVRNGPDALLTTAQAAELLNVHVNTLRRWSNQGVLETYVIGPRGDRRFKRRDINNFLVKKSLANIS